MLSEYLKKRGLNTDPLPIGEERKLTDETLALVKGIQRNALIALIQPRVDEIRDYLIEKAIPEEVPVMRQALVEIGGIIDDFDRYNKEADVRRELRDEENKGTETEEAQPSPPVEEGKEGSL